MRKFHPRLACTSGTSGSSVAFYVDKPANVLEFVFYWRYFGWGGYRLGSRLAELSAEFFMPFDKHKNVFGNFQPLTNRLMLNSLTLSPDTIHRYAELLEQYRPHYLKGSPSTLYVLAGMLDEMGASDLACRAVFAQGENLLSYQRTLIERIFNCRVFDHYGHMERTAAITQCERGSYHVHMDYGLVEFEETAGVQAGSLQPDEYIAEVIGTSLHNLSMPLIRYRTGDYVRLKKNPRQCPCGRGFPTVEAIMGRDCDVIHTPDGRCITALYIVFDRTPGIDFGQIIQDRPDRLIVRVSVPSADKQQTMDTLRHNIECFTGNSMQIHIEQISRHEERAHAPGNLKIVSSFHGSQRHQQESRNE
jgi:phenylacetate-CoA ligase